MSIVRFAPSKSIAGRAGAPAIGRLVLMAAMAWSCTELKASDDEPATTGDAAVSDGADATEEASDGSTSDVRAVRSDARSGSIVEYTPGISYDEINGFIVGPDDAVWISDGANGAVVRLAEDGSSKAYRLPGPYENGAGVAHLTGLAAGPDGHLWIGENS